MLLFVDFEISLYYEASTHKLVLWTSYRVCGQSLHATTQQTPQQQEMTTMENECYGPFGLPYDDRLDNIITDRDGKQHRLGDLHKLSRAALHWIHFVRKPSYDDTPSEMVCLRDAEEPVAAYPENAILSDSGTEMAVTSYSIEPLPQTIPNRMVLEELTMAANHLIELDKSEYQISTARDVAVSEGFIS